MECLSRTQILLSTVGRPKIGHNLLINAINLLQAYLFGCISAGLLRMYEYTIIPFYEHKEGAHFHLASRASPNIVYFCTHGTDTQ
jgi:hypothetical protein